MILRGFFYYLVVWSLVGYSLLAGINHAIGLDNSVVSLGFRAIGGVCAAALIAFAARRRFDFNLLMILIFTVAYATQLTLTLHLRQEPSAQEPIDYWAWAMGGCIFPALATYLCLTEDKRDWLFRLVLAVSALSTVMMLLLGNSMTYLPSGMGIDTGRWSIPTFNPIAMGHLGVTTILVSFGWFLNQRRMKVKQLAIVGGLVAAGALLLLLANSRGPLVSLGACLFTLALSRFNRKRTAAILIISGFGVAVLFATQYELIYEGILRRFSMVSTGQDQATELRLIAINGAWDQFLTSPLMGDGIEERNTGFYPHNVILEALMTTGLIGAIPFVLLLTKATHASWTIMRKHEEFIWLALIQVQYLIAAQLSGAIYQATSLWVSVAAVLAVSSKGFFSTSDQTSKRKRRPLVTSPARPAFAGPVR